MGYSRLYREDAKLDALAMKFRRRVRFAAFEKFRYIMLYIIWS